MFSPNLSGLLCFLRFSSVVHRVHQNRVHLVSGASQVFNASGVRPKNLFVEFMSLITDGRPQPR